MPPVDLDLAEIVGRRPEATICLASALARHELIDAILGRTDIAIPRTLIDTGDPGQIIGLYSPERSIVDAFRLRGIAGYETGIEALRNWLKLPASHPAELIDIARTLPRALGPLRTALDVLT